MAADTLKGFFVDLGFRVDGEGERRFKGAVQSATFNAQLLADAVEKAAATIAKFVAAITRSFDDLYFVSQRVGASAQNIRGLSYAFTQVGGTAGGAVGAIESFSRAMRTNPGIGGFVRSLGVATEAGGKARDTIDVLLDSIDAINKKHPYYTGAQMAGLLGLDEGQFNLLTKYRREIKEFDAEYKRIARTMGLDTEAASRASMEFARSLRTLSTTATVLVERLIVALSPALSAITKSFVDWLASHPEEVEKIIRAITDAIQAVVTALADFVKWFGDEGNQKKVSAFWTDVGQFVRTTAREFRGLLELLVKVGKYLGIGEGGGGGDPIGRGVTKFLDLFKKTSFVGSAEAGELPSGGGERPDIVRRAWEKGKRALGFGGGDAGGAGTKVDKTNYNFTGANADVLRQAAKELGTSPEDLATVISYETGGTFSPKKWGGKGGNYMGLIQFGPSERAQFGANDKQTFAEQMPAVVRYLKTRGFKPGMGLLDLYSTINAGRPGRYNASDGNGTVRSHVENMQRAHAARARQFLGSEGGGNPPKTPPAPVSGGTPGKTFLGKTMDELLAPRAMGDQPTTTDLSKVVTQNNPVTVNVQGVTDPQRAGDAVGRAVKDANNLSLRNLQTAIR